MTTLITDISSFDIQIVKNLQKQGIAKWSWEMLGTFFILVQSANLKCPRKSKSESTEFTLALDLDETLIHSNSCRTAPEDHEVQVKIGNIVERYFVKVRPYLNEFLRKMSQVFELVIFTASLKEYADQVIDYIDPNGEYITRRFYRDSCTKKDGVYMKDLTKVGPLDKTFIIDNSTSGLQLNNGIMQHQIDHGLLINSWYADSKDQELKKYSRFLSKRVCKSCNLKEVISCLKAKHPNSILN